MYVVLYRFNHRFQEFSIDLHIFLERNMQHVIQQCKNRLEQVRLRARGRSNQRSQIHVHIYEALNIVFLTFLKGKRSLNCQIVA